MTPKFPLTTIYWYVSGSCNLNCRHCWINPEFSQESTRHLPWNKWEPVFRAAREYGVQTVKLTGGEPLLHPEIDAILSELKGMGFSLHLETNGTLIDESRAKLLKATVSHIAISLDGHTPALHESLRQVSGSFRQTIAGAAALHGVGLGFQVITSLRRENADSLLEMPRFVKGLGATSLKVNPITGLERSAGMEQGGELLSVRETLKLHDRMRTKGAPDDVPVFFDVPPAFQTLAKIQKHGVGSCGILSVLGLLPMGRAGLCGIGEHVPELDFGDVLELGVRRIWEETPLIRRIHEELPQGLKGICGRCLLKSACLGKCLAQTFAGTRNLFAGFSFCEQAMQSGLFPQTRLIPARNPTT